MFRIVTRANRVLTQEEKCFGSSGAIRQNQQLTLDPLSAHLRIQNHLRLTKKPLIDLIDKLLAVHGIRESEIEVFIRHHDECTGSAVRIRVVIAENLRVVQWDPPGNHCTRPGIIRITYTGQPSQKNRFSVCFHPTDFRQKPNNHLLHFLDLNTDINDHIR